MADHIPTQLDHVRVCPTFAAVISRHRDSYVKGEEILKLQKDLEQLLTDAESRLAWLHMENDNIESSDKQGSSDSSDCTSPMQSPKSRLGGCKRGPGRPTGNERIKLSKLSSRLFKNKLKKPEADKVPTLVSDAPNKFWQTLDAWCSDITSEDVSRLQELLKSVQNQEGFYRVPALGTHYSQQWATEDMLEEQREASEPHVRNSEISAITPATFTESIPTTNTIGPLTGKLLSALVEDDLCITEDTEDLDVYYNISSPEVAAKSSWANAAHVEKRIREELIELGVLNDSDGESEDEVLTELVSKQEDLRDLVEYNKTQLTLLYDTALEYMKQQDIRHRIDMIDEDVCDTYRNFMLKKHKKIPHTKKEKEQATKLLEERVALNKRLQEHSFLST